MLARKNIWTIGKCKDQIWVLSLKGGWTSAQRAQNNEFVENGLENWALINQTNVKVDLDDKWMKLNGFMLKKIVLGTVRGDQFLYISFKFDYKVTSWLLQCFSLDFRSLFSLFPLLLYIFPFSSLPSTCRPGWLILILVPSGPSQKIFR